MGLHTPIDGNYRFGQLYGIRQTYQSMNENRLKSAVQSELVEKIIRNIEESGKYDDIVRFAKKNRTLAEYSLKNALSESFRAIGEENPSTPLLMRKRALTKAKFIIESKIGEFYGDEYEIPSETFTKTVCEASDDEFENTKAEKDSDAQINKLIKDTAIRNGFIDNGGIFQSEEDKKFEDSDEDYKAEFKHNYEINMVVFEAIAGNQKKTQLIQPTVLFKADDDKKHVYVNSLIGSVLDGINAISGINFHEGDFSWISNGTPYPHFKSEIAVTSELIRGNRLLNTFFGPTGQFKDYLFKSDSTPRIKLSDSKGLTDIEKDVNAIQTYPIVHVYATVISWDEINGQKTPRMIDESDFSGTKVSFVK